MGCVGARARRLVAVPVQLVSCCPLLNSRVCCVGQAAAVALAQEEKCKAAEVYKARLGVYTTTHKHTFNTALPGLFKVREFATARPSSTSFLPRPPALVHQRVFADAP